jgi:hypothetical protein
MQTIRIDFDNPGLPQRLDVVENDAQSRFFKAVLYKDGKAYAAPSGATYSIMYRGFGPQNEGWYDTINDGAGKRAACSVSGNVVTCEIARQALRVPGHVSVVLCVTGSNGYMLHGWPIDCNCRNDNYTGGTSVESFFYITQVTNADWTAAIRTWEELKNMIDPTLSLSGKAADAKTTGDNFFQIKKDLYGINAKEIIASGKNINSVITDNSAIYFPKDFTLNADLYITSKNVTLYGFGTINGSITINTPSAMEDGSDQEDANFTVDGLTINSDTNFYCIRLKNCRHFTIRNCHLNGVGIYYSETSTYGQRCNRGIITGNSFTGNYGLYINENSKFFGVGDITFANNVCSSNITNVFLIGVDGYKDNNNTYFMPSYTAKNTSKNYNIYAKKCVWVSICNSTLFEAGLGGILLDGACQNIIIANNLIGWCGQRAPSSGIHIDDYDASGGLYSIASIANNIIIFPTLHGISVSTYTGRITINANITIGCGNNTYYYGDIDLSKLSHYAINYPLVNEGMSCMAANNNACGDSYNISSRVKLNNNI